VQPGGGGIGAQAGQVADPVAGVWAAAAACAQGAVAVGDVQLGGAAGGGALHGGQVEQRQHDPVAQQAGREGLAQQDAGVGRGGVEDPGGQGAAFGGVGVEQAGVGAAVDDEREFPGEVLGVADAGVHALSADGAVDVGGAAGQQDAAAAVVGGQAPVDAEDRGPHGFAQAGVLSAAVGGQLREAVEDLLLGEVRLAGGGGDLGH